MQSLSNVVEPRNEETKKFLEEIKSIRVYIKNGIVFKQRQSKKTEALGTVFQVCNKMIKEINGK